MELYRVVVLFVFIIYSTSAFPQNPTENPNESIDKRISVDAEEGEENLKRKILNPEKNKVEIETLEDTTYTCHPPTGPPLPPENGYVKGDNYTLGSVIYVNCNHGYELNGLSDVHCIAVPNPWKHTVIWDSLHGSLPTCIKLQENEIQREKERELPAPPPPLASQGTPKQPTDDHAEKVEESSDRCLKEPESGNCETQTNRFYFDKDDEECKQFSACSSQSTNNFEFIEQCQLICLNQKL